VCGLSIQECAGSRAVHPAVDVEGRAGDEAVELAGEEDGRARDVLRGAAPAERDGGDGGAGGFGRGVRVMEAGAEDALKPLKETIA